MPGLSHPPLFFWGGDEMRRGGGKKILFSQIISNTNHHLYILKLLTMTFNSEAMLRRSSELDWTSLLF